MDSNASHDLDETTVYLKLVSVDIRCEIPLRLSLIIESIETEAGEIVDTVGCNFSYESFYSKAI